MKVFLFLPALILVLIHHVPELDTLLYESNSPSLIDAFASQLLHWNTNHVYGNALALTVILLLYVEHVGLKVVARMSMIIMTVIAIYLLIGYDLKTYKGFSGILYGLSMGLPLYTLSKGKDVAINIIVVFATLVMILPVSQLQMFHLDINANVTYDVHIIGAATGLFIASWHVLFNNNKERTRV